MSAGRMVGQTDKPWIISHELTPFTTNAISLVAELRL
jgi:hypothetical protein